MKKLTSTIILCSYNGEKYIVDQLQSILSQSRQADEVVIVDDCSKDKTFELINDFIINEGLDWIIYRNKYNKGWKKNFTDAFKKAKYDIIFCCDQDDIWDKNKIEKMMNVFESNYKVKLLGSKVTMVNERNEEIYKYLGAFPKSKETLSIKKINFDSHFYLTREPGCAIAFRKEILSIYLKYWTKEFAHDQLLWNISVLYDGAFEIDMSTIRYRRTDNTVFESASKKRSIENRLQKIEGIKHVLNNIENIINNEDIYDKCSKLEIIQECKKWIASREKLILRHHFFQIFSLIRKRKYYSDKILLLVDIHDAILYKANG